jgi:MFS-type transporter involved in bile tolerance (Atg22 family)
MYARNGFIGMFIGAAIALLLAFFVVPSDAYMLGALLGLTLPNIGFVFGTVMDCRRMDREYHN